MTGAVRWEKHAARHRAWQSPVVVDGVLFQGDCCGIMHAYDVQDTNADAEAAVGVKLGGCIESTPAVWKGASTSAPAPARSTPCRCPELVS